MRWVLVLAVAVLAAGCGGQKKTADEKTGAGLAKVETTCVEGLNCEAPEVKAAGRSCNPAGSQTTKGYPRFIRLPVLGEFRPSNVCPTADSTFRSAA